MKASFLARGICVSAILCAGVLLSHAAQQPQKIAILPLTAGGQEDINYIAEGLRDMIASRISSGAGLAVIEQAAVQRQYAGGGREAPSPEKVRSTGKALGADYVIFGSVAKMGDDLLIAVNMLAVAKGGAPFPVFSQTLGMNEVIPRLQLIAQEVRGAIEDGVLAPEEDGPSAGDRKGTERSQPAEAPTAGRVGPDPLMERDQAATPALLMRQNITRWLLVRKMSRVFTSQALRNRRSKALSCAEAPPMNTSSVSPGVLLYCEAGSAKAALETTPARVAATAAEIFFKFMVKILVGFSLRMD